MVDFGAVIGESAEWTKRVLFQPFNFKKWLVLTFIALMAGAMSNGCNFNSGGGNDHHYESQKQEQKACTPENGGAAAGASTCPSTNSAAAAKTAAVVVITIVAVIVICLIIFMLVMMWLGSIFSFVFLDDVIKNDASIKVPFAQNMDVGNSYFRFNIAFMAIFLAIFGVLVYVVIMALIKSGLMNATNPDPGQVMKFVFTLIPVLVAGLVLFIVTAFISLIIRDFAVPIMYKERIRTLEAWGKSWALIKKNGGNFTVYILIKIGLGIGSGIVYLIAFILGFLIVVIPMALLVLLLWFVSKALPGSSIIPYWVVIGIVLAPVCLFLLYCLMAINLPFAVFFRTYSLKFLERLDPQYAFIKTDKPVAAQQ